MSEDRKLLQSLCDLEIPNTIKFSPDGRHVLYSTELSWGHRKGTHAVSTLWLAKTGQENSTQRLTSGLYKDHAGAWAPDGNSIAFVSDRADAGKRWAIYVMPMHDGDEKEEEAYAITDVHNEKAIEKFAFSPDGKQIAFLSADEKTPEQKQKEVDGEDMHVWAEQWSLTRLRIVDLETRDVANLVSDRHLVDFSWSSDGMRIAFASSRIPELENSFLEGVTISTVNADLASTKHIYSLPRAYNLNLTWANDGQLYVCSGVPTDKSHAGHGIHSINPDFKSSSFEHVAFGINDDAVGLIKASNGEVLAKVEHHLESRICSVDGRTLYGRQQEIEAFDVASTGREGDTTFAIVTSDVNHPVEVFTTTDGGATMIQLSNHGEAFKSHKFGTCHTLSAPSDDATVDIEALYLSPATTEKPANSDRPQEALPTVVMIHGGPNTRLTNAFNTYYYMLTPYLLSLGYGVLLPNYRGSSGRGQKFAESSIGGTGKHDYADIITMTQHAITQGYANKDKLLICGFSQGGFLTFLCSVRNGLHPYEWKFRAAVAGSGISDSDAMALTSDLGIQHVPNASMPAKSVHTLAPVKGLPSGYIASIEERLAQTEAALLQALSTIHGSQIDARSSPTTDAKPRDMEFNEIRIAKVEEWQKYPLETEEHQRNWMQYKVATDTGSTALTIGNTQEDHAGQASDKRQLQGHRESDGRRKRQKTTHESPGNRNLLENHKPGPASGAPPLTRPQTSQGGGQWSTNAIQGVPLGPDHEPAASTPWAQGSKTRFTERHRASNPPSMPIADHIDGAEALPHLDQITSKAERLSTLHSRKYF
ncbi:putative acylamino-acid-releasing enzyme, partial [Aureobasidium melanogenum]